MKITINLSEEEMNGIIAYLKEDGEIVSVSDIERYVQNIVHTTINSPHEAVSDYIKKNK